MTINERTTNEPEEPPIMRDQVNRVKESEREQDRGFNVQERMISGPLGEAVPMHLAGLVRFHIICADVRTDRQPK